MLLRSSSTPILRSWISSNYFTNPSSPNNNINELINVTPTLLRTNTISTFTLPSPSTSPNINNFKRATCTTTLFQTNLEDTPRPQKTSLQRMFSSSGLDEEVSVAEDEDGDDDGGDGSGINGGDWHGGGGNGFNDYSSSNNSNNENGNMEVYFQKMIKANPGDPLLLGNYARFLKEVLGNLAKAEEYCERAILSSPSDANMLSLYADIIWQHRRDAQRANTYFDQAIKSAPNDCYVHASYARFLWDVEEEELGEEEIQQKIGENSSPSPPHFLEEATSHRNPILF